MSTSIGEIRHKRGTAAQWTAANTVLKSGELGFESDTFKLKIGDGSTAWNQLQYVTGSGGVGGINYIANSSADTGVSGWVTYADASQALPEDGLGGTPTGGLWVRSTETPLRGRGDFQFVKPAENLRGQGVAYGFKIDRSDLAKVLTISFEYESISGIYATGDLTVYIAYEEEGVTKVIQPSGFQVTAGAVGLPMKHIASFQTHASIRDYRLLIHVASESTSAYTLALTNIIVGPQTVQYGAPVTDKQTYSLSITATTTAPTFGTQVINQATWRRIGDSMEIQFQYRQSSVGTAGSGAYLFSLPAGYQIDSTKLNLSVLGTNSLATTIVGTGSIAGSGNQFTGYVAAYDATRLYIAAGNDTVNPGAFNSGTAQNFGTGPNFHLSFTAMVPILGWSSTVQMSDSTDTRVAAFRGYRTTNLAVTANVTKLALTTDIDTHGMWAGDSYTIPISGMYRITARALSAASAGNLRVYRNGTALATATNFYNNQLLSGQYLIRVSAGDLIDFRSDATLTLVSSPTYQETAISIERLSGPSAIAASERINARYTHNAGTSVAPSTATKIPFTVRTFDSHGSVTGTTSADWKFTSPTSGRYLVSAAFRTQQNSTATMGEFQIRVLKNGTLYSYVTHPKGDTQPRSPEAQITDQVSLLVGETIQIECYQTSNTTFNIGIDESGFFSIVQIGAYV